MLIYIININTFATIGECSACCDDSVNKWLFQNFDISE